MSSIYNAFLYSVAHEFRFPHCKLIHNIPSIVYAIGNDAKSHANSRHYIFLIQAFKMLHGLESSNRLSERSSSMSTSITSRVSKFDKLMSEQNKALYIFISWLLS